MRRHKLSALDRRIAFGSLVKLLRLLKVTRMMHMPTVSNAFYVLDASQILGRYTITGGGGGSSGKGPIR